MTATSSAESLLSLLIDVVQQTRTLRREVSVLDLPSDAAAYFHDTLSEIEQKAAKFIAFCLAATEDH